MKLRPWALAFGAAMAMAASVVPMVRSQPQTSKEPLGVAWSRQAPGVIAVDVSPGGERVLALDAEGTLRCYDERGTELWDESLPGADSVVTSRGGVLTVVYAARQPLARQVWFLDADGRRLHSVEPDEPVETAAISPDGHYAAVAAGDSILFCGRSADTVRTRQIALKSAADQVEFGPGETLYVSYADPPRVELVKSNGRVLWTRQRRGHTVRSISASADGKWLAVGSQGPNDSLEVSVVDWKNARRWVETRPGRAPSVRLCADGTAALLGYEHRVTHNRETRYERRLAYLSGGTSWTRGGAYTVPLYVSVDRAGEWVVALETRQARGGLAQAPRFRLFGRGGQRLWIHNCPTNILIATSSSDGQHIAAYRADGFLQLLRVAAR